MGCTTHHCASPRIPKMHGHYKNIHKNMQKACVQVLPYSFGMSESRVGEQVRLFVPICLALLVACVGPARKTFQCLAEWIVKNRKIRRRESQHGINTSWHQYLRYLEMPVTLWFLWQVAQFSPYFPAIWDRILEYMRYEDKIDNHLMGDLSFKSGESGHQVSQMPKGVVVQW